MDRWPWWATIHGVKRVAHDLATKPPQNKINSRLDTAEKKMSELEDVEIETIQNKTQREKGPKIKN